MSPDARGKVDELPIIFQTSKASNAETLKVLVAYGANLEARDVLGQTVVMDAFRYSSFDNVKYLLNNGANPNPINKKGVSLVEMVSKEIKTARKAESITTNV